MNRRGFLGGLLAAPVVITTPRLLMPIKPVLPSIRFLTPPGRMVWNLEFGTDSRVREMHAAFHVPKELLREIGPEVAEAIRAHAHARRT